MKLRNTCRPPLLAALLLALPLAGGATPLHDAAKENDVAEAKRLIEAGADVNAGIDGGWTPLHLAANNNALGTVVLLLEHEADVNAKNDRGVTPLHAAASVDAHKIAALLLEHGGNLHAKTNKGSTPLHSAVTPSGMETASLLLRRGAELNAEDNDGRTPITAALEYNMDKFISLFLENGADANAPLRTRKTYMAYGRNKDFGVASNTLLHLAAYKHAYETMELLIAVGANVNARNCAGETPLSMAQQGGPDIYAFSTRLKGVIDTKSVIIELLRKHGAQEPDPTNTDWQRMCEARAESRHRIRQPTRRLS